MAETKQKATQNSPVNYLNKNSKKIIIVALILAGVVSSAMLGVLWAYRNVVAIIGNQVILKSQVERQLEINKNITQVTKSKKTPTYDEAKNELITAATVLYAAKENNISTSQGEVDSYIKALADSKYDGKIEFVSQSYEQSYGYSESEYRNQIYYELTREKVISELVNNITGSYISVKFTDSAALEEYAKTSQNGLEAWAKSKAEELSKQITSGKKFIDLFKEVQNESNYPLTAYDQGDFTEITKDTNQFGETYTDLSKAKSNQIIGPIKGKNAYTLYYIANKNDGKFDSISSLIDSYKNKKTLFITFSINEIKSLFVNKAYACLSCYGGSTNYKICALFYCDCGSCRSVCAKPYPTCPSGHTCSLSGAICSRCSGGGCGGGGGGDPVIPPPQPVNGKCGSADGDTFKWDTKPNAGLCKFGSHSSLKKVKVTDEGADKWKWTCSGSNGGSSASCSAKISYKLTVVRDGCAAKNDGKVEDVNSSQINCDRNHIGANCFGWFTREIVKLKETINKETKYAFAGWKKMWDGATKGGLDRFISVTMHDNKKVKACFGYKVQVTVQGNGQVVGNKTGDGNTCVDSRKINCKATTGACDAIYDNLSPNLKLTATPLSSDTKFLNWKVDGVNKGSNTELTVSSCQNVKIVAEFDKPSTASASCSVAPINGLAPLVVRLTVNAPQDAEKPYTFRLNGNQLGQATAGSTVGTVRDSGSYYIQMYNKNNALIDDCDVINVKDPLGLSGGEVAP